MPIKSTVQETELEIFKARKWVSEALVLNLVTLLLKLGVGEVREVARKGNCELVSGSRVRINSCLCPSSN